MTRTQTLITHLEVVECAGCHVTFGIEAAHVQRLRRSHEFFYCPNGHRQHFPGSSDVERAAAEHEQAMDALKLERERRARADVRIDQLLREGKRERTAHKALLARTRRLKERVLNGVCPCCNRSFENLRRHIVTKHPEGIGA